jgi:hypothetical protein
MKSTAIKDVNIPMLHIHFASYRDLKRGILKGERTRLMKPLVKEEDLAIHDGSLGA